MHDLARKKRLSHKDSVFICKYIIWLHTFFCPTLSWIFLINVLWVRFWICDHFQILSVCHTICKYCILCWCWLVSFTYLSHFYFQGYFAINCLSPFLFQVLIAHWYIFKFTSHPYVIFLVNNKSPLKRHRIQCDG